MRDLQILKKFASVQQVDTHVNEGEPIEGMLRVYRDHPGTVHLQVRAHSKLNPFGKGKARNLIGGVSINIEEAKQVVAKLQDFIDSNDRRVAK